MVIAVFQAAVGLVIWPPVGAVSAPIVKEVARATVMVAVPLLSALYGLAPLVISLANLSATVRTVSLAVDVYLYSVPPNTIFQSPAGMVVTPEFKATRKVAA